MIRPKSTDVWYNAPGVVAAYQPIGAPDGFAARQNVGNDLRMAGRYIAMPGVLPAWSAAAGWTFDGSTQHLTTGVVPATGCSLLVGFSEIGSDNGWLAGAYNGSGNNRLSLGNPNALSRIEYGSGKTVEVDYGATVTAGVLAVAGQQGYRDGVASGAAIAAWTGAVTAGINIADLGGLGTVKLACRIQTLAISFVTISPAGVAQYSRQMAYCHVNPEWSAWGRRRRYYYAPSEVAAGNVGIYGRRGAVALPGGVRIEAVQ